MSDKSAEYVITAEPSGFVDGINKAVSSAKNGGEQINKAMTDMGGMFKNVMGHINAFAGLLAGGAFFKEGIAATARLTGETGSLSKMLGVSMRDASTLNVALKSIGSSSDVYTDSLGKLLKQVRTGESGVKAMGVATRGSNGELLNGQQLMDNAIGALKGYKEGTDRNLAAQALFGKGAAEVSALLKLNSTVMDEAAKKAEALGLVIGPEQAAKTKAYKESLSQVKMVLEGLQNAIGQSVMPAFTQMAKWFAEVGPIAVTVMREVMTTFSVALDATMDVVKEFGSTVAEVFSSAAEVATTAAGEEIPTAMRMWQIAMETLKIIFLELKVTVITVITEIGTVIKVLVSDFMRLGAVIGAALTGSWDNVEDAWQQGADRGVKIVADGAEKIKKLMAETQTEIDKTISGKSLKAKDAAPKAAKGNSYTGEAGPTDTKELSNSFKAQAAVMKAELEGQLAIQKEYLTEAQEAYNDAYKHNLLTETEYFAAKQAIEQQGFKSAIAIKENELHQIQALEAKAKSSGKQSDVLGLKAQELKLTAELTVLNAQAFNVEIKNTRELNSALQQKKFAMMEIQRVSTQQVGNAEIDRERILIQQKKALNQISDAEEIEAEKGLQSKLYQIEMQSLNEKEAQFDGNLEKIAANNAAKEQLERTHQTKMLKLDSDTEIAKRKNMTDMNKSIETGLQGVLKQAMMGSLTLKGLFKGVFSVITNAVTDMLAKTAIEWAKEALFGKAIKTATAISQITANAGIAGSAAYASIAAIPIVGPAMAPAAALAASAGAMSFAPMASAAGGYDIPAGINPVVQTHAEEMILPSKHANVIREMADGGGTGGGDTHIHINATDAQSVKRLFENHGGALVAALRKQGRNFAT